MTNILQWNSGKKLKGENSLALHRILSSTNTPIAILQETTGIELPSSWIVHRSGSATIVTLNTVQTAPLPDFTIVTQRFCSIALRVKLPGSNVSFGVISIYRSCGGSSGSFLDWLEDSVAKLPLHVDCYVLGGDFNIHTLKWGSTHDDAGASKLMALEESLGVEGRFLNTGAATRGPWPNQLSFVRDTAIDLTLGFTGSSSGIQFHNWKTGEQNGSDHFQIWFEVIAPLEELPQSPTPSLHTHPLFLKDQDKVQEFKGAVCAKLATKGWFHSTTQPANDRFVLPTHDIDLAAESWASCLTEAGLDLQILTQRNEPYPLNRLKMMKGWGWTQTCSDLKRRRKKWWGEVRKWRKRTASDSCPHAASALRRALSEYNSADKGPVK